MQGASYFLRRGILCDSDQLTLALLPYGYREMRSKEPIWLQNQWGRAILFGSPCCNKRGHHTDAILSLWELLRLWCCCFWFLLSSLGRSILGPSLIKPGNVQIKRSRIPVLLLSLHAFVNAWIDEYGIPVESLLFSAFFFFFSRHFVFFSV